MADTLNMVHCAYAAMGCFVVAGIAQTIFLKSKISAVFSWPLDMNKRFRGRRIFGQNKTFKGFVVLVPAVTLCFGLLGLWAQGADAASGLWRLTVPQWFGLGLAAGFGYALGELPNSFVKRQLGVEPGESPAHPVGRKLAFVFDQLDSILFALLTIALIVPTDWRFHLTSVLLGSFIHWLFNVLLWAIGVKKAAK